MDDGNQIEHVAREMIEQFGDGAAHVARELAEASDEVQDEMLTPAKTWREIADTIERLLSSYGPAQRFNHSFNHIARPLARAGNLLAEAVAWIYISCRPRAMLGSLISRC